MSKYNIGDKFVVEITDVITGMGEGYMINDTFGVTIAQLERFEPYVEAPLSDAEDNKTAEKKTYTPEELKLRIFALSNLLARTIEKESELRHELTNTIDRADRALEDYEL